MDSSSFQEQQDVMMSPASEYNLIVWIKNEAERQAFLFLAKQ